MGELYIEDENVLREFRTDGSAAKINRDDIRTYSDYLRYLMNVEKRTRKA